MHRISDVVIIGGGAAGFFAASEIRKRQAHASILILEKTGKTLSKVKISGGGRCNVTNACFDSQRLLEAYPRGNPWLKECFSKFSVKDTLKWFKERGVEIVAEADGRMFPKTNSSQTIIDALEQVLLRGETQILTHFGVQELRQEEGSLIVCDKAGNAIKSRYVVVATGGGKLSFFKNINLKQVEPLPSLFTFNIPHHPWKNLMGLSVEKVRLTLENWSFTGPLLITHWGLSGPVVLKTSAFAARRLAELDYRYVVEVDFFPDLSKQEMEKRLRAFIQANSKKKPSTLPFESIPRRLWEMLCDEAGLSQHFNWAEVGKKKVDLLIAALKEKRFSCAGKTTYKEEFVTTGGVSLESVDPYSCESQDCPNLFFAGEALDVDGITGGFNFQAAWSTAFAAASTISARMDKV